MSNTPEDIENLSNKISALQSNQAEECKEYAGSDLSRVSLVFTIIIEIFSSIIIGGCLGYALDMMFNNKYILTLIFIAIGGFAGLLNIYRIVNNIDKITQKEESKDV